MKALPKLLSLLAVLLWLGTLGCQPKQTQAPQESFPEPNAKKTYADVIIGYAQLGAESEWRAANTESIKETAEQLGIELHFFDAQQDQAQQIEDVRKLIVQKVDLIGISPIVETGWAEGFIEAKKAGIPIILVDRRASVQEDLYVSYLGSDFLEEGRNAARIMADLTNGEANIVELVGTINSAPANDRYRGFREILAEYPKMKIIASETGDFTRARGREVMEKFLNEHGTDITAVYAHNDDMADAHILGHPRHGADVAGIFWSV